MPKSSRRRGKPARPRNPNQPGNAPRPVATSSETGPPPPNPWWQAIAATEATLMREDLVRAASGVRPSDAELLADCATVERIRVRPVTITPEELERALLRAGVRRPVTLLGWRAKVEMALTLIQASRDPEEGDEDYDRMVPWLVLSNMLDLIDGLLAATGASDR